ncbi:MAG: PDZ domain-containing protein, partial [Gammaproteobacteria bacterium]
DRLCLDDLMRRLWQRYGLAGVGIPERRIEREVEDLLGESADDFFSDYIYGTTELPLADWFAAFGVALVLRPADSLDDLGGYRKDFPIDRPAALPSLGARLSEQGGMVRVEQVFSGGAAQCAGVSPGDLLVAIDGERCTGANLTQLLRRRRVGEEAVLTFFRRDRLRTVELPMLAAPHDTVDLCWLPDEGLSDRVKQRRARWLASRQLDQ